MAERARSDEEMRSYDLWLVKYADVWIDAVEQLHASAPASVPVEAVLTDLRNLLGGRVQHWKAEARRCRADQERHRAERESAFEPPSKVSPDVFAKRKRLLAEFRRSHDLTMPDLARRARMSESSIRTVLAEDRKRGFAASTRDRLLEVLGVSPRAWYEP